MRNAWKKLLAFTLALVLLLPNMAMAESGFSDVRKKSEDVLEEKKASPSNSVRAQRQQAARTPAVTQPFTVTKYPLGQPNEEVKVGDYGSLYDALTNCKDMDASNQYVVTLNRDYDIPEDEMVWTRKGVHILLRSAQGEQFTLKRKGTRQICALDSQANMRIENVILDGNGDGQGFFIAGGSVMTLGKGTVVQNFMAIPRYDGSAFYLYPDSNAVLNIEEGVLVQNNTTSNDRTNAVGVIEARVGTTVNISGGTFKNNKSAKANGGVLIAQGTLNITGGTFEGNGAAKNAGVIWIGNQCKATIENATFKENKSPNGSGGVIYAANDVTIKNCSFQNNVAKWGGAIIAYKKLTVENCRFTSNKTQNGKGGAIYMAPNGKITAKNATFTQNSAPIGGAVFVSKWSEDSKLSDCTFLENLAADQGGAVNSFGKISIENSKFSKNGSQNTTYGGALCFFGGTDFNVNHCEIQENTAQLGGGIFDMGGTLTVKDTTLKENTAQEIANGDAYENGIGGAILSLKDQIGNTSSKMSLENCTIQNNKARNAAGVLIAAGTADIQGTEFNGNDTTASKESKEKQTAGALYLGEEATVTIQNSSKFIGNKSGLGGAIFDAALDYNDPVDTTKYQNLTIDGTVLFTDNVATTGLAVPPSNYKDYAAKLAFDANSDVQHGVLSVKSLLNNYDVNYKNPNQVVVTFDANGGQFADKTAKTVKPAIKGEKINLITAPTKDGFTFNGWNTKADGKGTKVDANTVVQDDLTVFAQWKKVESKPDPKPTYPILRIVKIDGDGNRITLPVTFKITDKDLPMLSQQVTTNDKGVAEVHYLTSGDYSLSEIKTPDGYIPLDKPLSFSVTDGKRIRYNNDYVRTIYVTNNKKTTPENPSNTDITTIGGKDRKDVATNISKNYFGAAKKIIVVQDMAYADSMSAMNVSQGRYPILYVGKDTLYDETKQEILRTHRDEIIVMGGVNTISNKVYKELVALSDAKVTRVDGVDRYEVNRNSVVRYMPKSTKAVVASGMLYMDALSSVPYAHQMQAPIVLVTKNTVPPVIADLLSKQMKDAIIVGGANTIAPQNKANLEALLGKTIERITGADRYAVSANVSNRLVKVENAIVTSGEKWSDALVAGSLAQKRNAPVLLTAKKSLPSPIVAYLDTHKNLKSLITVGGSASIGEGVRTQLKALFPVVRKEK